MVKSMSFVLRLARNVVKIEKSKGMNCVTIIFGSKMYNNSNRYLPEGNPSGNRWAVGRLPAGRSLML